MYTIGHYDVGVLDLVGLRNNHQSGEREVTLSGFSGSKCILRREQGLRSHYKSYTVSH